MDFDIKKGKVIGIYAFLIAIFYLIIGIIEIFDRIDLVKRDIFGGLALFVISATYFASIKETLRGEYKGLSFIIGGIFLSSIFGILYILILFANWLEHIIGKSNFSLYLRPEIILFFAILPLAYLVKKEVKVRW